MGFILIYQESLSEDFATLKTNLKAKINPPRKAEDQFNLGRKYYEGKDIEQDLQKAIYWTRKAAKQDYADAQYFLGMLCCGDPEDDRIEEDYELAQYWLEKAANQGHSDAQTALGALYYAGQGIEQDYEKAKYWFTQAAEQHNPVALFSLGKMYFEGRGVERNNKQARAFFNQAKQHGFRETQELFGNFDRKRLSGKS